MIEENWTIELGSLALKNLVSKATEKIPLIPVTEDIIKLKKLVDKNAAEAYDQLINNPNDRSSRAKNYYKILAETTLISIIIHNRKRAGDVQYLTLESFDRQRKTEGFYGGETSLANEFMASLSETEKILTQQYIRLQTIGKANQRVPALIPRDEFKYFELLYEIRTSSPQWFPHPKNRFLFAFPDSKRYICGINGIRKWCKRCGAKYPNLLTVVRLRKHIATVTQILSLKDYDIDQFASFLGHTKETFLKYYR